MHPSVQEQRREYVVSAIKKFPTQVAAARAFGVDARVLHRWIKGECFPSPTIVRLVQLWEAMQIVKAPVPEPLDFY